MAAKRRRGPAVSGAPESMSRKKILAAVAGAVVAPVVVALIVAWLPKLGLSPNSPDSPGPTASSAPAPAGTPFSVAVRDGQNPCGLGWVVPKAPGAFPEPPSAEEDWGNWATSAAGVPAWRYGVDLTVQGRTEAQVTLTALRVKVVERKPALAGTQVFTQCGDPVPLRWVEADLDRTPPALKSVYSDMLPQKYPEVERRPLKFPYRISLTDAETLVVFSTAVTCDCRWIVELDWASEGRTGTETIRNTRGEPFRTTGLANVTDHCSRFYSNPFTCD